MSTEPSPAAGESPAYSSTATPMSADEVTWAVMAGLVPPPLVIGAVQMLISVSSEAANEVTLVYVLPALSVTPEAVAAEKFQTPTSTTSRLPAVTLAVGVTVAVAAVTRALACCTNVGVVAAVAAGVSPGRPKAMRAAATTTRPPR